jgi:hypothetical protein
VRLRFEVEAARFAVSAHFHVLGSALPHRHRRMRQVRQAEQRAIALMLDRIELRRKRFDLLRARLVRLAHRGRVLAPPCGARDLVAGGILEALETLDLRNEPSARHLERREVFQRLVGIHPAVAQTCTDDVGVIADERGVEHGPSIVRYDPGVAIVRKAVFPVAGLGTRFLPATKAQPKEMLPLVDKPIIQ